MGHPKNHSRQLAPHPALDRPDVLAPPWPPEGNWKRTGTGLEPGDETRRKWCSLSTGIIWDNRESCRIIWDNQSDSMIFCDFLIPR